MIWYIIKVHSFEIREETKRNDQKKLRNIIMCFPSHLLSFINILYQVISNIGQTTGIE